MASNDGVLDLERSVPIGHSHYSTPDPMGIFWTMYPLDPSSNVSLPMTKSDKRFWALDVQSGLFCHLRVFDGTFILMIGENYAASNKADY